ncbi:PAS domain S-box-containing protein [Desulfuromusa kysingii]|uniref:PAS domain S-box-containing protein n=1 Tax=Desulfuromusa kysingii TaxID=37625 RepID=A0A1H4DQS6_9BACT|nr:PAS domain S-box protein [Desulfuromusa kysingii]SEA74878.1 PAS domain S-box-containing protein [Desulfuromusa kysingii]
MEIKIKQHIYAMICEQAPDAILYADREGVIQRWNRGAEMIFGYTAKEAIGQPLDIIIPERLQQRHNDGYRRVMVEGTTKYGADLLSVPARDKDNHSLFSDFSIIMIKDDNGQMQGIAAIMRDSTAQKAKEKELREQIKTLTSTQQSE